MDIIYVVSIILSGIALYVLHKVNDWCKDSTDMQLFFMLVLAPVFNSLTALFVIVFLFYCFAPMITKEFYAVIEKKIKKTTTVRKHKKRMKKIEKDNKTLYYAEKIKEIYNTKSTKTIKTFERQGEMIYNLEKALNKYIKNKGEQPFENVILKYEEVFENIYRSINKSIEIKDEITENIQQNVEEILKSFTEISARKPTTLVVGGMAFLFS